MIIDCHGHYTTAPKALEAWRNRQIAGIKDPAQAPQVAELKISDDELRESIEDEPAQVHEGAGLGSHHLFAPRELHGPSHRRLRHKLHLGFDLQRAHLPRLETVPRPFHRRGHAAAKPRRDPKTCIPELERCVRDYGFVAINLNPDPSGGHWTTPPLTDRCWYPIYEKMVEWDMPAMVHVSQLQPRFPHHRRPLHQRRHDGGHAVHSRRAVQGLPDPALRRSAWRRRGAVSLGPLSRPRPGNEEAAAEEHLLKNVYFDTCVYHLPGIDLLTKVIPADNILFATEMIGAVKGIDPRPAITMTTPSATSRRRET